MGAMAKLFFMKNAVKCGSALLALGLCCLPAVAGAAADLSGAADLDGLPRFPRAWIVAYEREDDFAPREFVVSAVEKIRRELRIERKLRLEAPWLQCGHVTIPLGYDALVGGMAPECLFEVWEGDPRWTYRPEYGWIVISLGKMHYILDPDDLCRAHESRRSVVRSGCAFHDGTEKMAELRQFNFQ